MAVPKAKVSKARRDKRRSNVWKLENPGVLTCPKCGAVTVVDEEALMSEEIHCQNCGAAFDIEFGVCNPEDAPCEPAEDEE